jgi:hypothetical protein
VYGLDDKPWKDYVKQAEHYRAIGETKIYLGGDGEKPWQYAISCEPGGTHRIDIATDVRFTAEHAGLVFSWSFNIEPHSANGKGGYHIDVEAIQRVLAKLPMDVATNFVTYLKSCADAVEKKADEYQAEAQRQYGTAVALRNSTTASLMAG